MPRLKYDAIVEYQTYRVSLKNRKRKKKIIFPVNANMWWLGVNGRVKRAQNQINHIIFLLRSERDFYFFLCSALFSFEWNMCSERWLCITFHSGKERGRERQRHVSLYVQWRSRIDCTCRHDVQHKGNMMHFGIRSMFISSFFLSISIDLWSNLIKFTSFSIPFHDSLLLLLIQNFFLFHFLSCSILHWID